MKDKSINEKASELLKHVKVEGRVRELQLHIYTNLALFSFSQKIIEKVSL